MADITTSQTTTFDGNIKSLPYIQVGEYNRDGFLQHCALTLFCNTNFDTTTESPRTIAKKCKSLAEIMTEVVFGKK